MHKFVFSFSAILIGWVSGFLYYIVGSRFFSPWGRPTDVEAILVWTAVFIGIGWLFFVVPLISIVPESSRIFSLPGAPLVGAIGGLAAFLVLVGWWTGFWSVNLYLGYAAVVGAVTGLTYAIFLHLRRKMTPGDSEQSD